MLIDIWMLNQSEQKIAHATAFVSVLFLSRRPLAVGTWSLQARLLENCCKAVTSDIYYLVK